MALRFALPSGRGANVLAIDTFLGVDFTNYPSNVDARRSPGALNMVRDVPGKVRKSMGYEKVDRYDGSINGVFRRREDAQPLVHAGNRLYHGHTPVWQQAADAISCAFELAGKLWILDGAQMLVWDGETVRPAAEVAYTPVVSIANAPSGGGTQYEALNLISPAFTEQFLGVEGVVDYQLAYAPLDETAVTAKALRLDNGQVDWVALEEGTHFTVNRATGVVSFLQAPGKSPMTGEDNLAITACRTVEGYDRRIGRCTMGALYGVRGAADRLFLSGNAEYPHYDWYSGQNDPGYFPDTGYSVLGTGASAVMGYSIISNLLAAHKDEGEPERNVILREGTLTDGKPAFPIVNSLQGPGAIAGGGFGYLATEPLFLTRLGIYAITPQDVTGERYSQNRSFYLNGRLLDEEKLEQARAISFKDYYILYVNGRAYMLDGLQPVAPEKGMPYATRQYTAFYRENVPARTMWQSQNRLYFGTAQGDVYRFFDEPEEPDSYADDGAAIPARWETPDLSGKSFYKFKAFSRIVVRLNSALATGVRISAAVRGFWRQVYKDDTSARYLNFERLRFDKFTFSGDTGPKVTGGPCHIRRVDKLRLAFENEALHEPFGLFDIALEYRESGNAR